MTIIETSNSYLLPIKIIIIFTPVPAPAMSIFIEGIVQLRNSVTITCEAELDFDVRAGQVQFVWTKDSEVVSNSNKLAVGTVVQVGGTNYTYLSNVSLSSITENDGGIYTCEVSVSHPLAGDHAITATGIAATYILVQRRCSLLYLCVYSTSHVDAYDTLFSVASC